MKEFKNELRGKSMKKIIIPCVLIILVVFILVNSDAVYLKLQENNWNNADYYVSEINAERVEKVKVC